MEIFRLVFFSCLLLLAGGLQTALQREAVEGPYSGSFIPAGVGLKKPLTSENLPLQATQSWTIYCWVRSDEPAPARTLLAGFGEPAGAVGTGRYFALQGGRVSFWSGTDELLAETPLAPNRWQLLAATFDGSQLMLYSDGERVAARKTELLAAAPVIYLAPTVFPWADATHFAGKIANFTLSPRKFSSDEIKALMSQASKLDLTPFEVASKTWPVQTRGQDGLRAPQEPSTLPRSQAETQNLATPLTSHTPPTSRAVEDNISKRAAQNSGLAARGADEWAIEDGWRLIEAPRTNGNDGAVISRRGFDAGSWMKATVPGTVLTTLVEQGVYPDPDFGLNNLQIPESLNKQDYWYRTQFAPPSSLKGKRFTITLHGINYRAQVWFNGTRLGEVKGAFTRGEFDVSALLIPGQLNALAVLVSPPPHPGIPHEQSIKGGPGGNGGAMCLDGPTFICTEGWDWIPGVRDRDTGIWQDVTLKATGVVKIGDVHVITKLPLPDTTRATVSMSVPLRNDSVRAVAGELIAAFEGVEIRRRIVVAPGGTEVKLTPADFPQLNIKQPRLWWPNGYGNPDLYHLQVSFKTSTGISDTMTTRFGIREVSYELTLLDHSGQLRRVEFMPTAVSDAGQAVVNVSHEGIIQTVEGWVASFMPGGEASAAIATLEDRRVSPFLVIRVNGVRIACKGGNWGLDDSRKRVSREHLEPYFRLHRDAHLTMIRNWCGQNTEEVFYDLADEYGLLVWNDFWLSTQDFNLEPSDPALFLANAREVVTRFRNHPSIAIWCGRNEGVPPPLINVGLDELIRTLDGTRYYIPNSRSINLQDSGPWHYGEPETYFTRRGRGFSTEIGTPSPPSLDTMRAMLPPADQWPPSDTWSYHDWHTKGGAAVTSYVDAMTEEFGAPQSLEDFERKAQLMNYESHRAMFEGFNSHLWMPNTGRLMWMTHPAWPSMEWQMYSADYATHGAFYGIRKACEPLHVQLDLPGLAIAVINNTTHPMRNLRLRARVLSMDGEEIFNREEKVNALANTASETFRLETPKAADDSVVFIKLLLLDETGQTLSENFYWYAAQPLGYRKLNDMTAAVIECAAKLRTEKTASGASSVEIDLTNQGSSVALATEVTLRDANTKKRILPAYASDNFISLLPKETRRITVEIPASTSRGEMQVALTGWNVRSAIVPVQETK
jgi:hypothetical protein